MEPNNKIGSRIKEAKELQDTHSKKSKELASYLLTLPLNMEVLQTKTELDTLKDDLLRYLIDNGIDGMTGESGIGKIARTIKKMPSDVDWNKLQQDIIRKVLEAKGVKSLTLNDGSEIDLYTLIPLLTPDVTAMPFSILKREVNLTVFRSLLLENKKPDYIQVFEKEDLSLTK